MDLRGKPLPPDLVARLERDAAEGMMWYQPFIFADNIVVGTGGYWSGRSKVQTYVATPSSPAEVRQCMLEENLRVSRWYTRLCDAMVDAFPGRRRVLEIGCNAGWFMFELSKRGWVGTGIDAWKKCYELISSMTGLSFEYIESLYDSRTHQMPELAGRHFDVAIASAISTHLTDPHYFLSYIASLAPDGAMVTTPLAPAPDEEAVWKVCVPSWRRKRAMPETIEFLPSRAAFELMMQRLWPFVYRRTPQADEPQNTHSWWGAWLASREALSESVCEKHGLTLAPDWFNKLDEPMHTLNFKCQQGKMNFKTARAA